MHVCICRCLTCTSKGKSSSSRFSMKTPRTRLRSIMYASPLWLTVAVSQVASFDSLRMLSMKRSGFHKRSRSACRSSWRVYNSVQKCTIDTSTPVHRNCVCFNFLKYMVIYNDAFVCTDAYGSRRFFKTPDEHEYISIYERLNSE